MIRRYIYEDIAIEIADGADFSKGSLPYASFKLDSEPYPNIFPGIVGAIEHASTVKNWLKTQPKPVGADALAYKWGKIETICELIKLGRLVPQLVQPQRSALWGDIRQAMAETDDDLCELVATEETGLSEEVVRAALDAAEILHAEVSNEGLDRLASIAEAAFEPYLDELRRQHEFIERHCDVSLGSLMPEIMRTGFLKALENSRRLLSQAGIQV